MLWKPPSSIPEELWPCDGTAVNLEETTLNGFGRLMETTSKCRGCERPRASLKHGRLATDSSTGMNARQIIGAMNALQAFALNIAKYCSEWLCQSRVGFANFVALCPIHYRVETKNFSTPASWRYPTVASAAYGCVNFSGTWASQSILVRSCPTIKGVALGT